MRQSFPSHYKKILPTNLSLNTFLIFALFVAVFIISNAQPVQAQYVYGVSAIVTPNPATVDTYSATDLDYYAYYYYDPYVEGYLYQKLQPASPWVEINSGYAYGSSSDPTIAGGYIGLLNGLCSRRVPIEFH